MIGHAAPLTWQPCRLCGREWPTKRLHDGMCLDCHPDAVQPRRTRGPRDQQPTGAIR
jgi:hypothetical protein